MAKRKVTITLSDEALDWIDKEVKSKRFSDRSHAVEYSLSFVRSEGDKQLKELENFKQVFVLKYQFDMEKDARKKHELGDKLERLMKQGS